MPPRLKPSSRSMVSVASAHRLALQPLPSSATRNTWASLEFVKYAAPSGPIATSLRKTSVPGCTERREQGALGAVDPEVGAAGADAVGAAGDVDAAGLVHRDAAGGEAAVGAVAAEPLGRLGRADRAAVDLTAGHLADVEHSAPLVGADALELRADRAVAVAREQVGRRADRGRGAQERVRR